MFFKKISLYPCRHSWVKNILFSFQSRQVTTFLKFFLNTNFGFHIASLAFHMSMYISRKTVYSMHVRQTCWNAMVLSLVEQEMGWSFRLSTGKSFIFPLHTGFVCLMTSLLFQPPSQLSVLSLIFMTFIKPEGLNSDKTLSSVSLVIYSKSNVHAYIEKDKNVASTLETLQVFRLNCFVTSKILDNLINCIAAKPFWLTKYLFFSAWGFVWAGPRWPGSVYWVMLLWNVKVQSAKCFSYCAAYLKCWVGVVDTPVCF